ncbi:glycoside hydrolase domain-containing protein [Kitasatospora sp. NPDC096077]|uniref:glycoside hydrolase domain-containing protein n=1 Tax=Kitasatospora sp. NPDC096077 TaxID=3155544 RepID=UPI0033280218
MATVAVGTGLKLGLDLGDSPAASAAGGRLGLDFNTYPNPSPSTISANGYSFVCQYLAGPGALTRSSALAFIGAGIDVVCNWEMAQYAPLNGYSQGVSDAQRAQSAAAAAGMPTARPIYFSVDWDVQSGDLAAVEAYFDGIASVIGRDRTGAYGGYYVIQQLFNTSKISWGWQTYAWSGGSWDSRAQLRQVQNNIQVGGTSVDKDQSVTDDFGQWGVSSLSHVYALSPSGTGVFQWNGSGMGWTQIGGPAADIFAGGASLFATNPTSGNIYRYNGTPNSWSQVGSPGYTFALSNDTLYGLTPNRQGVFQWNGSGSGWTQIGGPASTLYSGGFGLFATNPTTGNIHRYNGSPNNWSQVGGPGFTFAVSNNALYGLSSNQQAVFQWNGSGTSWTQIGGPATYLYGGGHGLLAVNPTGGNVFQYNGSPNNWSQIGGPGYTFCSTGGTWFGLTPNQDAVFEWSGNGTAWSQIGTPADLIVAGS